MSKKSSPFVLENHGVEDVVVDNVQRTEENVAGISKKDTAEHASLFFLMPANEEMCVDASESLSHHTL